MGVENVLSDEQGNLFTERKVLKKIQMPDGQEVQDGLLLALQVLARMVEGKQRASEVLAAA